MCRFINDGAGSKTVLNVSLSRACHSAEEWHLERALSLFRTVHARRSKMMIQQVALRPEAADLARHLPQEHVDRVGPKHKER